MQVSVMHAYGGRIADDAGKTVTIKSDATRRYLEWVKDAWDQGLFPPGNTTWDGGGDNQAYLSGQAAFVANTGSIGIASSKDDPELFEATGFSSLPAGPEGFVSPIQPNLRAIPATSQNPEAARALLEHLSQPEFMNAYYEVAIYGPVLQGQADLPAFDGRSAIQSGLLDLVRNGTPPGYPDVYNVAYADADSNFVIPKMVQRVVVDGYDLDAAMDEAQEQTQAIYDKYA
ncbi:MAG: extracellular solute-binding protein [Pseudomonadota bacterium]